MLRVVSREKHVRIRVIRIGRQLHQQQRSMYRQGNKQNGGERNRSRWKRGGLTDQGTASGKDGSELFDSQVNVEVFRADEIPAIATELTPLEKTS